MKIKYQVNKLENMRIGFQRKDPKVFNGSVLTMGESNDMNTIYYNFSKIMPLMIYGKLPVVDAVNNQPEYPVISVDAINSLGGGNENPTTNGNCHVYGFDEKMIYVSV
ncbi:hypothetical protein RE476_10365 [Methanolobus mangrovi]|uniref:Uncharacterized protein n=1 Tax=Methanolobus mangrovi TaxID=3072977 RepID=A0AA51UHG6_9EURY|nr:hypothetical protein [Methanolobus mangrovi]WMW21776.1 hypothetical protein RE476_10365 [Methanolobus mangrovi]